MQLVLFLLTLQFLLQITWITCVHSGRITSHLVKYNRKATVRTKVFLDLLCLDVFTLWFQLFKKMVVSLKPWMKLNHESMWCISDLGLRFSSSHFLSFGQNTKDWWERAACGRFYGSKLPQHVIMLLKASRGQCIPKNTRMETNWWQFACEINWLQRKSLQLVSRVCATNMQFPSDCSPPWPSKHIQQDGKPQKTTEIIYPKSENFSSSKLNSSKTETLRATI